MKISEVFFLLIIFTGITFGSGCSESASRRDTFFTYELAEKEKKMLLPGDIIMRRGYGFVSNTIVKTLKEDYSVSHAGIINKDKHGDLKVIHSVSQTISDFDGVQDVDLDTFIRDSHPGSIIVVRFKSSNADTGSLSEISKRAEYYLDQKIPFDYSFSFEDTTRFFCTEFIGRVFADIYGQELFDQFFPSHISGLDRLKFGAFLDPELFETVINHHP
ncbi:MAG: hypothetical protein ABR597_11495 [Bacteroidales bacterium]